jgi:hypothetical protein
MLEKDWTQDIPPSSDDCDHATMSHSTVVADRRVALCCKCGGRWWRPVKTEKRSAAARGPAKTPGAAKKRRHWWVCLFVFLITVMVSFAAGVVAYWVVGLTGDRTAAITAHATVWYLTYWRLHDKIF